MSNNFKTPVSSWLIYTRNGWKHLKIAVLWWCKTVHVANKWFLDALITISWPNTSKVWTGESLVSLFAFTIKERNVFVKNTWIITENFILVLLLGIRTAALPSIGAGLGSYRVMINFFFPRPPEDTHKKLELKLLLGIRMAALPSIGAGLGSIPGYDQFFSPRPPEDTQKKNSNYQTKIRAQS